jgi:DNA-binding NarL/FixJ family response regulator
VKPIRIVLADDHALFRAGLRSLLQTLPDLQVVAEAGSGRQVLDLIREQQPDVVLMDIAMQGINGLEATAQVVQQHPRVRVIMLSMHASEVYVSQALRSGATGYLLKDAGPQELETAIRTVRDGGQYLTPAVSLQIEQAQSRRGGLNSACELSPRQREIVQLIANGHSTQEIANILFVSVKTVEAHRAQIMERLDIRDVAGLTRYAMRTGLITPDE